MSVSQPKRILEWLRGRGPLTTFVAVDRLGITNLPGRISELRRQGHQISGETIDVENRFGDQCRVMCYRLIALAPPKVQRGTTIEGTSRRVRDTTLVSA